MNPIKRPNEWPQSRRGGGAARLASNDDTGIVALSREGVLRAMGTGQSITQVQAAITSRVRVPMKVVVPRGTYIPACGATPEHGRPMTVQAGVWAIASRRPRAGWRVLLGDPTNVDAVPDLLVHNTRESALTGPPHRGKRATPTRMWPAHGPRRRAPRAERVAMEPVIVWRGRADHDAWNARVAAHAAQLTERHPAR